MVTFQGAVITNGALPAGILSPVDATRSLRLDAADSWLRVEAAVQARYGWTPQMSPGKSAYRTYQDQVTLFLERYSPSEIPGSASTKVWQGRTYYLKRGMAEAATPGTSNHGYGLAVDVALGAWTSTQQAQFMAVAAPLGWTETEGRAINEPWHKVYDPNRDTHTAAPAPPAPVASAPVPLLPEVPTMARVVQANGQYFEIGDLVFNPINPDYVGAALLISGQTEAQMANAADVTRAKALVDAARTQLFYGQIDVKALATQIVASLPQGQALTAQQIADEFAKRLSI